MDLDTFIQTTSPSTLIRAVAKTCGLERWDITGVGKSQKIMLPRVACYWALRKKGFSFPKIGEFIGNRHHSTVIYGLRLATARHIEVLEKTMGDLEKNGQVVQQ